MPGSWRSCARTGAAAPRIDTHRRGCRSAAPVASAAARSAPAVVSRSSASRAAGAVSAVARAPSNRAALIGSDGSNAVRGSIVTAGSSGRRSASAGSPSSAASTTSASTRSICSIATFSPVSAKRSSPVRRSDVAGSPSAQLDPGSSKPTATAAFGSSDDRNAAGAASLTAALPTNGTATSRLPSARAMMQASTAPIPSSSPIDSAPNSTSWSHTVRRRSTVASATASGAGHSRSSSVSTDSCSQRCSSVSSRSIVSSAAARARGRR